MPLENTRVRDKERTVGPTPPPPTLVDVWRHLTDKIKNRFYEGNKTFKKKKSDKFFFFYTYLFQADKFEGGFSAPHVII